MRILIAGDAINDLSSAEVGAALASGWPTASVQILPIGEAGAGFLPSAADRLGLTLTTEIFDQTVITWAGDDETALLRAERVDAVATGTSTIPYAASSVALGGAIARMLRRQRPRRLYIDLVGLAVHDGGAGLLAGLGARGDVPLDRGVAGLRGLTSLELAPARAVLGETTVIGVVPADQVAAPLLGLRGITSLARQGVTDPALLLATDAALETLARLAALQHAQSPGAGACGGLGLAVLALGGQLVGGPEVSLEAARLGGLDLVVTGTSVFDFAARGGGVVKAAAAAASTALAPCVVVAGTVFIGAREMRTMGVDAAYAVHEAVAGSAGVDGPMLSREIGVEQLAALAARVARSWSW